MMVTFLQDLMRLTLQNPRGAARRIIGLDLPLLAGVLAILLVSVVAAGLGYLGFAASPAADDARMQQFFGSPVQTALVQIVVQGLTGFLAWAVGRQFGGQGRLADALLLNAWVEAPLILMQVAQLLVMGISPVVAETLGMVGLALYVVLLTLFITELHGFRSAVMVFVGILATTFVAATVVVTIVAALFGLEGLANV